MKKMFIICFMVVSLVMGTSAVMAQDFDGAGLYTHSVTGAVKYFDKHPGSPSQWIFCDDCDLEIPPEETCETDFEGLSEQSTSVFVVRGDYDVLKDSEGNDVVSLNKGSMGYANQDSAAGFYASSLCGDGPCGLSGGIGIAAAIGGGSLWASNDADQAWVAGLTGSVSIAGLFTSGEGEAWMYGSGEMGTVAYKVKGQNMAIASSYGEYSYSGQTSQNAIMAGLGVTGGGSYVYNSTNDNINITNVGAVSGQVTIVGAGSFSGNPVFND